MVSCEIVTLRNKTEWKQQNEYMYVQLLSIKKNDIRHFCSIWRVNHSIFRKEDHFYDKYI